MKRISKICAALLALGGVSGAKAATVYLSQSGTAPTVGVPTVSLSGTSGSTITGTLFAWIDINPATEGYSGISLSAGATQASGDGSISATSVTQTNTNPDSSARWDTHVSTLNSAGNLVTNSTQLAISSTGINQQDLEAGLGISPSGPDSVISSTSNEYKLFALNYSIVAPTTSTTATYNLFLKLGSARFGVDGAGNTVGFGTPGDLLQVTGSGATVGAASAQPDAVINVSTNTPEPATLGLAGVAALIGLRRRRA